jgi:hypothetical protein
MDPKYMEWMATEVQNGSVTTKEAIVPNLTTLKHISPLVTFIKDVNRGNLNKTNYNAVYKCAGLCLSGEYFKYAIRNCLL